MTLYDALAQHWVAIHGTSDLDPLVGTRWNAHRAERPELQALPAWEDDGTTSLLSESTLRALANQDLSPQEEATLSSRLEQAVASNDLHGLMEFLPQHPASPDDLELVGMGQLAAGEGAWRMLCQDIFLAIHLTISGGTLQVRIELGNGTWSDLVVTAHGEDDGESLELTPELRSGAAYVGPGGVLGLELGLYRYRHQRGAWRSLVAAALQPTEMELTRLNEKAPAT
jgi:hypothetical protein